MNVTLCNLEKVFCSFFTSPVLPPKFWGMLVLKGTIEDGEGSSILEMKNE